MSNLAAKRLKWALLIAVPILLFGAMWPGVHARREQKATQKLLMECRDFSRNRAGVAALQKLIDEGANVNGRCLGDCPTDLADDDPTPLQLILRSGSRMTNRDSPEIKERDDISALKLLLQHGADINARDKWGRTALMVAVTGGSPKYTRFLIDKGADVTLRGDSLKLPNSPTEINPNALDLINFLLSSFSQKSWWHGYEKDDLIRIQQMLVKAGAKPQTPKP